MTDPPSNIRALQAEQILEVTWPDGRVDRFPYRFLRSECPCASCRDEWTGERILKARLDPPRPQARGHGADRHLRGPARLERRPLVGPLHLGLAPAVLRSDPGMNRGRFHLGEFRPSTHRRHPHVQRHGPSRRDSALHSDPGMPAFRPPGLRRSFGRRNRRAWFAPWPASGPGSSSIPSAWAWPATGTSAWR